MPTIARMLMSAGALLATCLGAAAQTASVREPPVANPKRVLFVGNSLLYYSGGLQSHVHRMAAAATPPIDLRDGFKSVHVTSAPLDQYPIDFFFSGGLGNKEPWQLLVIAGGSYDATTDAGMETYRKNVHEFDAAAKKAGARIAILWMPAIIAPNPLAKTDLAKKTEDMVLAAAKEVDAFVIPIALAYREAYRLRPDLRLQMAYDGNHGTLAGQYLSAAVVFASLYKQSPVGNPYNYFGALDDDTRAFVQKVADDTVKTFYGR
jgi:hypothetical protein